jgi:hypothetical protein
MRLDAEVLVIGKSGYNVGAVRTRTATELAALVAMALVMATSLRDSAGAGLPVTQSEPLNTNAATDTGDDSLARLAADSAGTWIAVWTSDDPEIGSPGPDPDILFSRSQSNGQAWSQPAPVSPSMASESHVEYQPDIAVGGSTWITAWSTLEASGTDADIRFSRSTDGGMTWSEPALLNDDAEVDTRDDDWVRLATDGDGVWLAVWQWRYPDTSAERTVRMSRSLDDGLTWSPAQIVPPAGELAQTPDVSTDGDLWLVTWDVRTASDHDIRVARSNNEGATWTAPVFVNTNGATDSEHDMVQAIANDGGGGWLVAWQSMEDIGGTGTDWDLLFSRSNDGISWT